MSVIDVTFTPKRLMGIWDGMIQRCHNKKNKAYKNYGARGITVCDKWRYSFPSFAYWALCNGYEDNLTIDRIRNDGSYNPRNCRFITLKDQQSNRSDNLVIRINNVKKTASQWSKLSGLSVSAICYRYHGGLRGDLILAKSISATKERNIHLYPLKNKLMYKVRFNNSKNKITIGYFENISDAVVARDNFIKKQKESHEHK